MAAVTPERVKQNLTYICKQLEPQQFLLGVVDILHDFDGELLGKKIEKSTDLSRSMLVLQIYDCLKRRPNWTRAFVNFLLKEGELDILRKLGVPSTDQFNSSQDINYRGQQYDDLKGPSFPQSCFLQCSGKNASSGLGDFATPRKVDPLSPDRASSPAACRKSPAGWAFLGHDGVQSTADARKQAYDGLSQANSRTRSSEKHERNMKSSHGDITFNDVVDNVVQRKHGTCLKLHSESSTSVSETACIGSQQSLVQRITGSRVRESVLHFDDECHDHPGVNLGGSARGSDSICPESHPTQQRETLSNVTVRADHNISISGQNQESGENLHVHFQDPSSHIVPLSSGSGHRTDGYSLANSTNLAKDLQATQQRRPERPDCREGPDSTINDFIEKGSNNIAAGHCGLQSVTCGPVVFVHQQSTDLPQGLSQLVEPPFKQESRDEMSLTNFQSFSRGGHRGLNDLSEKTSISDNGYASSRTMDIDVCDTAPFTISQLGLHSEVNRSARPGASAGVKSESSIKDSDALFGVVVNAQLPGTVNKETLDKLPSRDLQRNLDPTDQTSAATETRYADLDVDLPVEADRSGWAVEGADGQSQESSDSVLDNTTAIQLDDAIRQLDGAVNGGRREGHNPYHSGITAGIPAFSLLLSPSPLISSTTSLQSPSHCLTPPSPCQSSGQYQRQPSSPNMVLNIGTLVLKQGSHFNVAAEVTSSTALGIEARGEVRSEVCSETEGQIPSPALFAVERNPNATQRPEGRQPPAAETVPKSVMHSGFAWKPNQDPTHQVRVTGAVSDEHQQPVLPPEVQQVSDPAVEMIQQQTGWAASSSERFGRKEESHVPETGQETRPHWASLILTSAEDERLDQLPDFSKFSNLSDFDIRPSHHQTVPRAQQLLSTKADSRCYTSVTPGKKNDVPNRQYINGSSVEKTQMTEARHRALLEVSAQAHAADASETEARNGIQTLPHFNLQRSVHASGRRHSSSDLRRLEADLHHRQPGGAVQTSAPADQDHQGTKEREDVGHRSRQVHQQDNAAVAESIIGQADTNSGMRNTAGVSRASGMRQSDCLDRCPVVGSANRSAASPDNASGISIPNSFRLDEIQSKTFNVHRLKSLQWECDPSLELESVILV